jgi:diguanylate cyclase (GGDEF)-like protein/PAS domain S-box-containing protein
MTLAEADVLVPPAGVDNVLLDNVHTGVCVIRDMRFMYVNRCLADMLGHDVAHMLGDMDAIGIVHPDDRPDVLEKIRRRDEGEITAPYDIRLVGEGGRVLHARVCGVHISIGGVRANLVTMTDISEVKRALHAASWRARMLALTEDLCLGASMEIDAERDRVVSSPGLWALLGRPATNGVLSRRAVLSFVRRTDRRAVVEAWRQAIPGQPFELQHALERADGSIRLVHQRGYVEMSPDGCARRGIVILQDITARRDVERRLHEAAGTDVLTGLASRTRLLEQADRLLSGGMQSVTILVVEFPQIAQVKQGLGFESGDCLAGLVGARLQAALPPEDVLARLSGGEFALIADVDATADVGETVSARARLIAAALGDPFRIGSTDVFVTCAIGAAHAPEDGRHAAALLSAALVALKSALAAGPGQVRMATSRGNEGAMRQLAIESALRSAIANGELSLLYQPQVELRYGGIQGVEALLRWDSAILGSVSPAEFVPVAERSGQIVAIGEWVLRSACAQAAAWQRDGLAHLRVHVNVSAAQLARDDLAERVQAILLETGTKPDHLGVEITESMLAADVAKAARALATLRAIGVEISLDDFGTGYSNLSSLRALPIDVIKIDRSYVHDVLASPTEVSMTRAVITLAHSLQMRVIAEGVESEGQLALLLAHRCDAIQGFYFSQPVTADAILALVREDRRLPAELFDRPPRRRTLLLVDDEENILASLKRLLRRGDFHIVTATSAAEGLQRLAEIDVDVIVSDQRMPNMTGVEFLRRAKDLYPHTVRIVLSGYTELQSITDAINEGSIYKFLTKPWEDDLLRANIEEAFRQKELADENRRLDQEVRSANTELADLNQRLQAALARQHEELSVVEDSGRHAMEVLFNVPMPLIGFDIEGLVAFANQDAEALLPGIRAQVGNYAQDALPEPFQRLADLRTGDVVDVARDGRVHRCSCRAIEDRAGGRGTLVAIVPLMTGPA